MATITDIARACKVSIATVSRVLSYDDSLSATAETKRKIFEAAEKLNYTKYKDKKKPDSKEVLLKNKRLSLGVIQWRTPNEELDDVYYMSIRMGVEKRAATLGYNLLKISSLEDPQQIQQCDGLLAIGQFNQEELRLMHSLHEHFCVIGSSYPLEDFDGINTDFAQAAQLALDHLYDLGHRQIAFLGAETPGGHYGYRKYKTPTTNTYIDYTKAKGLFQSKYFIVADSPRLDVSTGESLAKKALAQWGADLPTAILAANDACAIGIIHVLQANQIKIPKDISVMGINDLSISAYVSPPLSTVRAFTDEMGAAGVDLLHRRINQRGIPMRTLLSTELVVRKSTGKPR